MLKRILFGLAVTTATVATAATPALARPHHAKKAPHKAKLSMDEARKIALEKFPGTVKAEELENEHKIWIYSFEIRPTGGKKGYVKEVNIDADSGKIVEIDTERD